MFLKGGAPVLPLRRLLEPQSFPLSPSISTTSLTSLTDSISVTDNASDNSADEQTLSPGSPPPGENVPASQAQQAPPTSKSVVTRVYEGAGAAAGVLKGLRNAVGW